MTGNLSFLSIPLFDYNFIPVVLLLFMLLLAYRYFEVRMKFMSQEFDKKLNDKRFQVVGSVKRTKAEGFDFVDINVDVVERSVKVV